MAKAVKISPKMLNNFIDRPVEGIKRVAAYGRVSSDQEEQKKSYDNQVTHYDQYIKSKPD